MRQLAVPTPGWTFVTPELETNLTDVFMVHLENATQKCQKKPSHRVPVGYQGPCQGVGMQLALMDAVPRQSGSQVSQLNNLGIIKFLFHRYSGIKMTNCRDDC